MDGDWKSRKNGNVDGNVKRLIRNMDGDEKINFKKRNMIYKKKRDV